MYSRGMTVREIQAFLAEHYRTDVAHDFIGSATDAVLKRLALGNYASWSQSTRSFFLMYRGSRFGTKGWLAKAAYLRLGVLPDGTRDILGIWTETIEDTKF